MKDDPIYCPKNVALYEALYGKNLISLGGQKAIDNMFSGLKIEGLKALDVGFGLGGVAFYLAIHYSMQISGVEIHPWMVQHAKAEAPGSQVDFFLYDTDGKLPFADNSFDLVYSKGVFNHVHQKLNLLHEVQRVLKSGGLLVIADWIFPGSKPEIKGPIVCETEHSYRSALQAAQFSQISIREDNSHFLKYVKELLERLTASQKMIEHEYGKEMFEEIQQQHERLIVEMQQVQRFAVRITAISI